MATKILNIVQAGHDLKGSRLTKTVTAIVLTMNEREVIQLLQFLLEIKNPKSEEYLNLVGSVIKACSAWILEQSRQGKTKQYDNIRQKLTEIMSKKGGVPSLEFRRSSRGKKGRSKRRSLRQGSPRRGSPRR